MPIPKEIRDYLEAQIQYYINESGTYKVMATTYNARSVDDLAFGMVLGCLYLGFIQACKAQHVTPNSEDMNEFHDLIDCNAARIRDALQNSLCDV